MFIRRAGRGGSGSASPENLDKDGGPKNEGWKEIQKRVFTRWCNQHLRIASTKMEIEDLKTGFSDGVRLVTLVQVLSQKKVGKFTKNPRIHAQRMENVELALALLKKDRVRLVNIGTCKFTTHANITVQQDHIYPVNIV